MEEKKIEQSEVSEIIPLDFGDALENLKDGKKVCCMSWNYMRNVYLEMRDDGKYIYIVMMDMVGKDVYFEGPWNPTQDEILGDWRLYGDDV